MSNLTVARVEQFRPREQPISAVCGETHHIMFGMDVAA